MSVTNVGTIVRYGNVEKALSIFKKRVKESGILQEFKNKQEYVKPSVEKRKKKMDATYRAKKDSEKNI
jgi:small subunit ribosomal protein S21